MPGSASDSTGRYPVYLSCRITIVASISTGISDPSAPGAVTGQRPGALPGSSPRGADRPQRGRRVRGQSGDQPGHHRIGGHRSGQFRLSPQHGDIGQAIPAQRQRHHQVSDDPPWVMHRPRRPPPRQPGRQAPAQAGGPGGFKQQERTGLGHKPLTVSGRDDLGMARGILHGKSAFGSARTGPSASPILPGQSNAGELRRLRR